MNKRIESRDFAGELCVLRLNDGTQLFEGDRVKTFRDEIVTVKGGRAPHKPSSEGKVFVDEPGRAFGAEYYAGVIGAQWVRLDETSEEK